MDADLDTLATALYVRTDDLLKAYPERSPARPKVGIEPKITDAELITLAVMQALAGRPSEARWLRHAHVKLRHLFPYLPKQPGYNKRLRHLGDTIGWLIGVLARDTSMWTDDVWVVDSTPVECGRSRETARRSDLAGWAEYGYCASHSRYFWGLRLHLLCTLHGLPVGFALTGAKADERETLLDILDADPELTGRPGRQTELNSLEHDITGDERSAMVTASFLDRLRGTGPLPSDLAARHGALGPIGRASGIAEDVRVSRPYDAYRQLAVNAATGFSDGDVQARLRVRWAEVHESFRLVRCALTALAGFGDPPTDDELRTPVAVPDGRGVGWAEAPQGEVLYIVETSEGRLRRVIPRSASFHNLPLFHRVFAGDVFTDFPFIEASFGLSIAGVAG